MELKFSALYMGSLSVLNNGLVKVCLISIQYLLYVYTDELRSSCCIVCSVYVTLLFIHFYIFMFCLSQITDNRITISLEGIQCVCKLAHIFCNCLMKKVTLYHIRL